MELNSLPRKDLKETVASLRALLPHLDASEAKDIVSESYYIARDGSIMEQVATDKVIDKAIEIADSEEEQDEIIAQAKAYFKNWEE